MVPTIYMVVNKDEAITTDKITKEKKIYNMEKPKETSTRIGKVGQAREV